jgi:hypothetical protein
MVVADGFGPADGLGLSNVTELFWAMATDGSVLAVLPFAVGLSLLIGWLAHRWLGFRFGWSVLAALAWAGVVAAMFFSGRADRSLSGLDPTLLRSCVRAVDLTRFDEQAVLNLAMYVPAAFAGVIASRRWKLTAAATTALVFVLEALQALLGRGACDSADLVYNLVGALAGLLVAGPVLMILRGPDVPADQPVTPMADVNA